MTTTGPEAPTLPVPGFTRELTPTWLATAALLAGERPPEVARLERVVHLGCGTGETVAVVAASHPHTEVWAWDPQPEHVEATSRLGDAAGLANLRVHEQGDLPLDLGGGPADVVIVQDVLAAADDARRERIAAAVAASLRPGGLLCATYPTLAAWAEIAPVQRLMRELARGHVGRAVDLVPEVLGVLGRLREGGARFLVQRPVVGAWLDHLATLDPALLTAQYLRGPFRPMSPAQVASSVAPAGCRHLGSARLTDDLGLGLPPALAAEVSGAVNRVVQETYRDLATRQPYRLDVFRLGSAPLTPAAQRTLLGRLSLAGLAGPAEEPAVAVDRDAWRKLTSFGVSAAELHHDPDQLGRIVRILMDAGHAHPVVANGPSRGAVEACEALDAAWAATPGGSDLRAVALLGSATSTARSGSVRGIPAGRQAS